MLLGCGITVQMGPHVGGRGPLLLPKAPGEVTDASLPGRSPREDTATETERETESSPLIDDARSHCLQLRLLQQQLLQLAGFGGPLLGAPWALLVAMWALQSHQCVAVQGPDSLSLSR